MLKSVGIFILLFCVFTVIRISSFTKSPSDTAAGAIVMACGIFINGPMRNIHFIGGYQGEVAAIMLFLLWIFIGASFVNSIFQKSFSDKHLKIPIKRFAIGTWVAGTSVCGIAIYQRVTWLTTFAGLLFFANAILWVYYIRICVISYGKIFKDNLFNKVHGVLLLSTVSTQSIVVFGSTIFGNRYPALLSKIFILIGIIFYVIAFILILKRYLFNEDWSVEDDWQNTNCILHGAMSITGLASVVSGVINFKVVLGIWLWVLIWFLIVETIEVYRAWKRIIKYGFMAGIAAYDVTQWSRVFTFGMLYTFTMKFNLTDSKTPFLLNMQKFILQYGLWIVVCIITVEILLFFGNEFKNRFSEAKGD